MSDDELIKFLGLDDLDREKAKRYVAAMDPIKRAGYERMAQVCDEIHLWQQGVGSLPSDVIICHEHKHGGSKPRATEETAPREEGT